jgi:hypothetical protein
MIGIPVHHLEEDIFVNIEFVSLDYNNSNSFLLCEVC